MADLLHVTDQATWATAEREGGITPPIGGFIHLCTPEQLAFVLDRHFAGRHNLLALHLEPGQRDIRWETSEPGMDPFPHLYEHLPTEAVTQIDRL